MPIENVSDTARWVAVYRAMETDRQDAIFRDPFARTLAGAKGEEIVDTMPQGRRMAWAMIVRTAIFDEIILARVRAGADLVVNLAAGLDARPWRLDVPPSLRWVDVDLPDILRYKTDSLRGQRPVCHYEAIHADLTNASVRQALFERLGAGARNVLVVTEGLLIYLTPEQVGTLATDLHAVPAFHWWAIDIANPRLMAYMSRSWGKAVKAGNAPFQFAPAEGPAFFDKFGWREAEFRSVMMEARRLQREMKGAWIWRVIGSFMGKKQQEEMRRMSGIVLMERKPGSG